MTELLSPRNPRVGRARLLARDRKERERTGLAVLEGIRLAEEALQAGVQMEYVLFTEALGEKERGAALLAALRTAGVPLYQVAPETLDRAADTRTPQGIVGVFRTRRWRIQDLKPGLVLVLDGVQDPGNAGTAIRSLEAMGGSGLVLAGGVDPFNPKVIRSSMGSLFRLPVITLSVSEALPALGAEGRQIFVADADGPLLPWTADLSGSVVLVIGSEAAGPSAEARRHADGIVRIPMPGPVESLNAGVAASLLVYEAMRQRAGR